MDAPAVAGAARLVLAAVLVVAAFSKLRAPRVTRAQTVALVGNRTGPTLARAVPFAEVAVALLLCVWWTWVPGVLAAALLLAFTAVVVRALTRHLPCPCFGGGANEAVGAGAVLRNGVLVACAVLATGSPSGAGGGGLAAATVALGLVVGLTVRFAR